VGLAIPVNLVHDHYLSALVHSLADPLVDAGASLVTRVVHDDSSEKRLYGHWAKTGGVQGVALLGLRTGDWRVDHLRSLNMPFASVLTATTQSDDSAVVVDTAASVRVLREFFDRKQHQRVVYFSREGAGLASGGPAVDAGEQFEVVAGDSGTAELIKSALEVAKSGPVTLLFDSDVDAAEVMAECSKDGLSIPGDVSIVSWTESKLCQSTTPPITAVNRRGTDIGALLGKVMLATIDGDSRARAFAPEPFVVQRESA
jgi:DNA-binding LacI/PurR family transcriptional regulator